MRNRPFTAAAIVLAIAILLAVLTVRTAEAHTADVRDTATWSADIAPHGVTFAGTALCDGFLPSDLEAWNLHTGARLGDDELRYVAGVLPGFGLVLSSYDQSVRVHGWCG